MYAANLSWKTLKSTLDLLETKGYVELTSSPSYKQRQFAITQEGLNVLGYYKRLERLVKVDIPAQS
jgi:predicted transcriptional regulator